LLHDPDSDADRTHARGWRRGWNGDGVGPAAELNAKAGRRAAAGAVDSPWSCIRTLIRSSGWVLAPATIEAIPPSTKPLIPMLFVEIQRELSQIEDSRGVGRIKESDWGLKQDELN